MSNPSLGFLLAFLKYAFYVALKLSGPLDEHQEQNARNRFRAFSLYFTAVQLRRIIRSQPLPSF